MRRFGILLSTCLLLLAIVSTAGAQVLWNPCGCCDQCGSCCSGCQTGNCDGPCWGAVMLTRHDPAYFQPCETRPFGSFNEHIMSVQRRNGIVAQFVFYDFHYRLDEATGFWSLSNAGMQNAGKIAQLWPNAPAKIMVEPSGRPDWDNMRRDLALQALASAGLNCTGDDVVIGSSHILGLVPNEPEKILDRRQQPSPYIQGTSSSSTSVGSRSMLSSPSTSGGSPSSTPRN